MTAPAMSSDEQIRTITAMVDAQSDAALFSARRIIDDWPVPDSERRIGQTAWCLVMAERFVRIASFLHHPYDAAARRRYRHGAIEEIRRQSDQPDAGDPA